MDENSSLQEETKEKDNEKRTKKGKAWRYVLATLLALVCFVGGGLTTWYAILDDEVRSLVRMKSRIDREYYEDISDEEFYDVVFDAVSEKLLDKYSTYYSAEEYAAVKSSGEGNKSGLGVGLDTSDDKMLVVEVYGNSPAENAGVRVGDYIVAFGKTQTDMTESGKFDDLSAFLQTLDDNEKFSLRVIRKGETVLLTAYKSKYVENYVYYRTNGISYTFTGKDALHLTAGENVLSVLDDDTAYIRLASFNGNAAKQFGLAMDEFRVDSKKNLVLDLRGNGGGYLDIMQEIASYFCKSAQELHPVVAVAKYGNGKREEFAASGNFYRRYFTSESRICVLADNNTASAAECLIGCMVDYGATTYADICLISRGGVAKTFGKGIMQTTYLLSPVKKDAVKLTTAKIYWPISNNCIHGRGVLVEDGTKVALEDYATVDSELIAAIKTLF